MSDRSYENNIKFIFHGIINIFVNENKNIQNNLDKSLELKMEENNFNEEKYIDSLKYNIIYFKANLRYRQVLLSKWIENGSIPGIKIRNEEQKKIDRACTEYVEKIRRCQDESINEEDLEILRRYQSTDKNIIREKIELEYKSLSIYNNVLSNFIDDLCIEGVKDLSYGEINDVMAFIKLEIESVVNLLTRSIETNKISIKDKKEESYNDKLNYNHIYNDGMTENMINDNKSISLSGRLKKVRTIILIFIFIILLGVAFIVGKEWNNSTSYKSTQNDSDEYYSGEGSIEKETDIIQEWASNEYIIPDSSIRYLTESELENYSKYELAYIRNEIFARHGYIFKNEEYDKYFSSKTWYYPDVYFTGSEEQLNNVEKVNIKLIKSMEEQDNYSLNVETYSSHKNYDYIDPSLYDEYYSIYTEAYLNKTYAENYVRKLYNQNIESTIIEEDGFYKVRVGVVDDFLQAQKIARELESMSIDTYILGYSLEYEEEINYLRDLVQKRQFNQFEDVYRNLKEELYNKSEFVRYNNELDDLYEEYITQRTN